MKSVNGVKLIWDEWNREHIKKHGVSEEEVNQAFKAKRVAIESYKGRLIIVGKTVKNRLLTIVLSFEKQKNGYIVSARDSSKKERKTYNDKNKSN